MREVIFTHMPLTVEFKKMTGTQSCVN